MRQLIREYDILFFRHGAMGHEKKNNNKKKCSQEIREKKVGFVSSFFLLSYVFFAQCAYQQIIYDEVLLRGSSSPVHSAYARLGQDLMRMQKWGLIV